MLAIVCFHQWPETTVLGKAVEGQVTAARQNGGKVLLGIGGRIGMGGRTELFHSQTRLVGTAGCGMTDVFAEDGEGAPKGKGLECENYLGTTALGYLMNKREIATQQSLL